MWKDRFIFRETWSRPPFTTLFIQSLWLCQTQKLGSFNVEMLKSICNHFEISFKSRDRKHQLIEKLAAMIAECSCEKSWVCWAHHQTVQRLRKKHGGQTIRVSVIDFSRYKTALMKLFQRFYCDQFGKKMFHLTTQRNLKGKRSDFLVCC